MGLSGWMPLKARNEDSVKTDVPKAHKRDKFEIQSGLLDSLRTTIRIPTLALALQHVVR